MLLDKLKKDISFALRRGTIAKVTTALDAGQRAAEDELALNVAGWDRSSLLTSTMLISFFSNLVPLPK